MTGAELLRELQTRIEDRDFKFERGDDYDAPQRSVDTLRDAIAAVIDAGQACSLDSHEMLWSQYRDALDRCEAAMRGGKGK